MNIHMHCDTRLVYVREAITSLCHRYESLKSKGKLSTFLEKRRKKISSKEHRFIPYERRPLA